MKTHSGAVASSVSVHHRPSHRPAIVALLAFAIGICLDRWMPLPMVVWLSLAGCGLAACLILNRNLIPSRSAASRGATESMLILFTFVSIGGGREHLFWNLRPLNDLSSYLESEPQTVRLTGIVATPIEILFAKVGPRIPSWMEIDHSTCQLQCESLDESGVWKSISGRARLEVTGHLVHVGVGDRIEVIGHLAAPGRPRNPGSLDYAQFVQRQGIGSIVRVEHPVAVKKLGSVRSLRWTLARWRSSLREACQDIFFRELRPDERGMASSLLLGDRTDLNDRIADQFAESGTMHLLAISGLHVGILLGLVLAITRMANLSSRSTAFVLLATVLSYAFLTDHRPPVLRAAMLTTLAILGIVRGQRIDRWNMLAVCGLLLLIWHPTDLFDIGAQLSFLAVGAILWSAGQSPRLEQMSGEWTKVEAEYSPWRRGLQTGGSYLFQIYLMTAAIWLATMPLTIFTFHLVAPVGILLNVVLIPYIALVLGFGYLLMLGGLIFPGVTGLLAVPFRWTLGPLQAVVEWGQSLSWGHFYVATIPLWWVIGFYLILIVVWQLSWSSTRSVANVSAKPSERNSYWGLNAILLWIVVGLCLPFGSLDRRSFNCTFLSVGHGLASIIEFPSGETVLYDAGTIGDGERATRAVENALWSRGISRLDAIFISHADHDHFSGVFGLLEKFPVQTIFVNQQFLDFQQSSVQELCEQAAAKGIPIQLLLPEDRIELKNADSQSIRIEILDSHRSGITRSDNANSLVMAIHYAGRSLLLTGDLEKEGLIDLLRHPPVRADVMLSPHHGGNVANVLELYDWAQPRFAIVSSRQQRLPHLKGIPETCTLLNTATSGAIRCEMMNDGQIRIEEYLKSSPERSTRNE